MKDVTNRRKDDRCEQGLENNSKYSESSSESRKYGNAGVTKHLRGRLQHNVMGPQGIQIACDGDSSESSQESSNCVGSDVSVPRLSCFKNVSKLVGLTAAWQHSKVEGESVGTSTASNAKVNNASVHKEFNFFL